MAKRYRYAFAKRREEPRGKLCLGLFIVSVVLLLAAVIVSFALNGNGGVVCGGLCLFSMMLSVYGFFQGLKSFSNEKYSHTYSVIGSIANGILMVLWVGIYLAGI
ncbi:MAG: hypothetical protein Q4E89_06405 [Eubacteriales bacterium]|nr:hypothetical protein [Eubacteriales bacterium]